VTTLLNLASPAANLGTYRRLERSCSKVVGGYSTLNGGAHSICLGCCSLTGLRVARQPAGIATMKRPYEGVRKQFFVSRVFVYDPSRRYFSSVMYVLLLRSDLNCSIKYVLECMLTHE
jgi:hypothetical protein